MLNRILLTLTLLLTAGSLRAATPMFLKIADLKGESTDDRHARWIDINSFNSGVKAGGQGGKPEVSVFSITKYVDAASPTLFVDACSGKSLGTVVLEVTKPSETRAVILRYTLSDATITSLAMSGGGDRPAEEVSFTFSKIDVEYIPMNSQGAGETPLHGTWDVRAGKVVDTQKK